MELRNFYHLSFYILLYTIPPHTFFSRLQGERGIREEEKGGKTGEATSNAGSSALAAN